MKIPFSKIKIFTLLTIPLLSILLHWKAFQLDLVSIHVWRQSQTQNTIQSFYEEDFNILNPRRLNRGDGDGIFRMEFPIMQWLFAGVYKVFGNHLIISRLLSLLIGLFAVLGMYFLGKIIFQNEIAALITAWCFNFSPSFFYHTVNPMPDNFALCCAIWGLVFFFKYVKDEKYNLGDNLPHGQAGLKLSPKVSCLFWSGFFLSLATLAKLPFILFLSVPFVYQFLFWKKLRTQKMNFTYALLIYGFQLFPMAWYAWVIPTWHGNEVTQGMFSNQQSISELMAILFGNLISTLPELLLNYAALPFFFIGIFQFFKNKIYQKKLFPVFGILLLSLLAYFLFEMNLIGLIHDYYLFPFFPLLFLMVGFGGFQLWKKNKNWAKVLVLVTLLIAPLTAHLRISNRWNSEDVGFNKDFLTYKMELQNAVPSDALCVIGNDYSGHILFYYTHKKGWRFEKDNLSEGVLKSWIAAGAEYLYSDSRVIDKASELQPYFEKRILEKGSVRIFKLQLPQ